MSLPPQFNLVGTATVVDSAEVATNNLHVNYQYVIPVGASDPEGDALTYSAYFMPSGMTFDTSTNPPTLNWTVPPPIGKTYTVKLMVTTPSGGSDAIIASFVTIAGLSPRNAERAGGLPLRVTTPNPVQGHLDLEGDFTATGVRLEVYDLSGRRVVQLRQASGSHLTWDLHLPSGAHAPAGVYFIRAVAGVNAIESRVVIL